jgi:hypothetical protein
MEHRALVQSGLGVPRGLRLSAAETVVAWITWMRWGYFR